MKDGSKACEISGDSEALLIQRLSDVPEITAAFLHGSSVKGGLRPDSDVDIALLLSHGARLTLDDRLDLVDDLSNLSGRPVDLGVLGTDQLVYAKEVIESGRLLFTKDVNLSDCFIALCLSMYVELQENRREVLHAYSA